MTQEESTAPPKKKRKQSDFVSDGTFKRFFNKFIIKRYDGNLRAFSNELELSEATVVQWAEGIIPSAQNLQIILNSNLDDAIKHEFAAAVLHEVFAKQTYNNAKGVGLGQGGGVAMYLQLQHFPEDLKAYWQERCENTPPLAIMNDPEKNFENIMFAYAKGKTVTFEGLIQTYWEALREPSLTKFSAILNIRHSNVKPWLNPEHTNARPPKNTTLESIAKSRFIMLSDKGLELFTRIAKGRNVTKEADMVGVDVTNEAKENSAYTSLEEIQRTYAAKLVAAADFKERNKIAQELYCRCIAFTGYSDRAMAQKTGFPPWRLKALKNGVQLIDGISCADPEDAFILASAFAGTNEALKNNLAANFLALPEYRDLPTIKRAFFLGGSISEAFLYTRLLVRQMNRDDFSESLGIHKDTLRSWETKTEKRLFYDNIIKLITTHWEPTENDRKLALKTIVNSVLSGIKNVDEFKRLTLPGLAEKLGLSDATSFWKAEVEPEKQPAREPTKFEQYYAEEIANGRYPQRMNYKISFDSWQNNFISTSYDGLEFGGKKYEDSFQELAGFVTFLLSKNVDAEKIDVFDMRAGKSVDLSELVNTSIDQEIAVDPTAYVFKQEEIHVPTVPLSRVQRHGNPFSKKLFADVQCQNREPSVTKK